MSLKNDTIDNLQGFSLAKYSTWMYYKPIRTLFDAGEGLSTSMRNFVFGIDKVFLSHGHHDHISGLPGLVFSRMSARGDKEKALEIYYPYANYAVMQMKAYIEAVAGQIPFRLDWIPISSGASIVINEGGHATKVVAFKADHGRQSALGYSVVETRSRLRKDLVSLSGKEIAEIAKRDGRDAVKETYEHIVLAYSGDGSPVPFNEVREADVLVHEATFVNPDDVDVDRNGHSSVRQAITVAHEAHVKVLILYHFSGRYTKDEAIRSMVQAKDDVGYKGDIVLFWKSELISIF